MNWDAKCAERAALMTRSSIREILKLTQRPEIISFAGGLPAPELFPVERVKQAADQVLTERGAEALQYSATEGVPELRDFIAERMSRGGVKVTRDNILIVSGAQQGISLIGSVLLNDGDPVVVECPTYMGMLQAWRPYRPNYLTVPTDDDGVQIEALAAAMRRDPKLIYLVPNFQNPQSVTLSEERRGALVDLLAARGGIVVEDNPYGDLRYGVEAIPSLYEIDARHMGTETLDGHVIYVGTFSKILAPGLRVAWIAAPVGIIDKLVQAKQAADLHTSPLSQLIISAVVRDGFLDQHISTLREVYHERRDIMLDALERYFPDGFRWTKPDGGLFLLASAREDLKLDMTDLFPAAIERRVAYVPGDDFFVGGGGENTFRLNFSNACPEMIESGIRRLGELFKAALQAQPV